METVGQTRANLDYLGGFFDGEGCVGLYRRNMRGRTVYVPEISVTNTNRLPLQAYKNVFGGAIRTIERGGKQRTCYTWRLSGVDKLIEFIKTMAEYTLMKSSELAVLMKVCESMRFTARTALTQEQLDERAAASDLLKEMKRA